MAAGGADTAHHPARQFTHVKFLAGGTQREQQFFFLAVGSVGQNPFDTLQAQERIGDFRHGIGVLKRAQIAGQRITVDAGTGDGIMQHLEVIGGDPAVDDAVQHIPVDLGVELEIGIPVRLAGTPPQIGGLRADGVIKRGGQGIIHLKVTAQNIFVDYGGRGAVGFPNIFEIQMSQVGIEQMMVDDPHLFTGRNLEGDVPRIGLGIQEEEKIVGAAVDGENGTQVQVHGV